MCLFCALQEPNQKKLLLYEDALCYVILDAYPDNNGHSLVIPKKHVEDIMTIEKDLLNHLFNVAQKISKELISKLQVDRCSFIINYGESQAIKHFHLHVVPNYHQKEEIKPINDIYNQIKN